MKRKYYVHYYMDFGNTYNLYYANTPEMEARIPEGAERITRKKAERLARAERARRINDAASAFRADGAIYPAGVDSDFFDDPRYKLRGCIWERA